MTFRRYRNYREDTANMPTRGAGGGKRLVATGLMALLMTGSAFFHTQSAAADNYLENLELAGNLLKIVDVGEELPSLSGSFLAAQSAGGAGDDAAAIENYRRAIDLDPENTGLKQSLFMALVANGDIGEAIKLLNVIPPESQNQNVNHVVIATNALKQKSWAQAVSRIDRINGADLDNMLATVFGAWALYGDRKIDEALARVDGLDGPDWTLMIRDYHAGLMLSAAGREEEALVRFEQAITYRAVAGALTDAFLRATEATARSLARTGKRDVAMRTVDDGLALVSGYPTLLALKEQLEDPESKITPLVTTATAGGAEIFFDVGTAISRQGGLPFAQGHLQLARFLTPENAAVQFALGNVYSDQDRYARANEYYGAIGEDSPYSRRARLEMALNYNRMEQVPLAVETLGKLVEQDPDDLVTVLSLGGVHAQHKQFEEAIPVYTAAIDRIANPGRNHWSLFYRRGIAYERTKQWPKAEADFKKSLELSPEQADVLNYLGYSWIDQGINLDEGLAMVQKAVELRPNSGFIIDSLGWAYYRLGRYEDAVGELERALELMPSDPVVNDHLGDAYWKTGRRLEATFQWKHALSNDPEEDERITIEQKLQNGLTH